MHVFMYACMRVRMYACIGPRAAQTECDVCMFLWRAPGRTQGYGQRGCERHHTAFIQLPVGDLSLTNSPKVRHQSAKKEAHPFYFTLQCRAENIFFVLSIRGLRGRAKAQSAMSKVAVFRSSLPACEKINYVVTTRRKDTNASFPLSLGTLTVEITTSPTRLAGSCEYKASPRHAYLD